jgi:pimeloyl-ACP methyl ester carboxylesterase
MRSLRRLAAVAAAALALAACTSSPASHPARGPAPTRRPPGTLAGYYHQRLAWHPCHKVFQCARLLVPFDYQRPAWRRFSLPVIRLRASNPAHRIGSLVMNPGGPGGSGVQFALAATAVVSAAARARFDVVGFDPRGVAGSLPAIRCVSDHELDVLLALPAPGAGERLGPFVAATKAFDAGCARESGALLPYVGTANAARDMDVLRAALGDAKLTYLGKSYGTYLGAWYAKLFPRHVRALVLDGPVDPTLSALAMSTIQAEGFQVALRSFITDCVARPNCPLGHGVSVATATGRLQALLNRTVTAPLSSRIPGQPTADSALILTGVASSLYTTAYWKYLRLGLARAFSGDGTVMVALADALAERSINGHYSNLIPADTAISCVDRPYPRAVGVYAAAAATAAKAAPQFGASDVWGGLNCAFWPVRATAAFGKTPVAAGAPPILVVGTTRDPATPYQWARALAGDLASGVVLGWNGDGHTAYMRGSACVDTAVDNYLINLVPPRSGRVCA